MTRRLEDQKTMNGKPENCEKLENKNTGRMKNQNVEKKKTRNIEHHVKGKIGRPEDQNT